MDKGMAIILSALITGTITLIGVTITQFYNHRNNKLNEKALHEKNIFYKKIDKIEEIINLISEFELRINYCGSAIVCIYTNNLDEEVSIHTALNETDRFTNEGNNLYKELNTLMAIYLDSEKINKLNEVYINSDKLVEQCPNIGGNDINRSEEIVRAIRDEMLKEINDLKTEIISDLRNTLER